MENDKARSRFSQHKKTLTLVELAVLCAIIILMAFTPIGYLKVGVVQVTFITIPVVVGAIHIGPLAGAFLGGVFGATSIAQCFMGDFFGMTILSISPVGAFVVCIIPRVLMGLFVGIIFRGLFKIDKTKLVSFGVSSMSGAILNTVFFVGGFFIIYLPKASEIADKFGAALVTLVGSMLTINAIIEALTCFFVGGAITKAIYAFSKSKRTI